MWTKNKMWNWSVIKSCKSVAITSEMSVHSVHGIGSLLAAFYAAFFYFCRWKDFAWQTMESKIPELIKWDDDTLVKVSQAAEAKKKPWPWHFTNAIIDFCCWQQRQQQRLRCFCCLLLNKIKTKMCSRSTVDIEYSSQHRRLLFFLFSNFKQQNIHSTKVIDFFFLSLLFRLSLISIASLMKQNCVSSAFKCYFVLIAYLIV